MKGIVKHLAIWTAAVISAPHMSLAQNETNYIPGKAYVIRLSKFVQDKDSVLSYLEPSIQARMDRAGGMVEHMRDDLYAMSDASTGKWFVAYFNNDRQSEESLKRDFYVLVWLFHGHDLQIMPLERTNSPEGLFAMPGPKR